MKKESERYWDTDIRRFGNDACSDVVAQSLLDNGGGMTFLLQEESAMDPAVH